MGLGRSLGLPPTCHCLLRLSEVVEAAAKTPCPTTHTINHRTSEISAGEGA